MMPRNAWLRQDQWRFFGASFSAMSEPHRRGLGTNNRYVRQPTKLQSRQHGAAQPIATRMTRRRPARAERAERQSTFLANRHRVLNAALIPLVVQAARQPECGLGTHIALENL